MELNRKKISLSLNISVTEETLNALLEYRNRRKLPSLDDAASALLADKLGKSPSPMWTDSEILSIHEGGKTILVALYKKSLSPAEIAQETGIEAGVLRAYLAHLTRRYNKLKKEHLHLWNDNIEKYEINPRYSDMIARLLLG